MGINLKYWQIHDNNVAKYFIGNNIATMTFANKMFHVIVGFNQHNIQKHKTTDTDCLMNSDFLIKILTLVQHNFKWSILCFSQWRKVYLNIFNNLIAFSGKKENR